MAQSPLLVWQFKASVEQEATWGRSFRYKKERDKSSVTNGTFSLPSRGLRLSLEQHPSPLPIR